MFLSGLPHTKCCFLGSWLKLHERRPQLIRKGREMSGFVVLFNLISVRFSKKSLANIFHSKGEEMTMTIFETRSDKPAHSHVVALLGCLLVLSWGTLCIFWFQHWLASNPCRAVTPHYCFQFLLCECPASLVGWSKRLSLLWPKTRNY